MHMHYSFFFFQFRDYRNKQQQGKIQEIVLFLHQLWEKQEEMSICGYNNKSIYFCPWKRRKKGENKTEVKFTIENLSFSIFLYILLVSN